MVQIIFVRFSIIVFIRQRRLLRRVERPSPLQQIPDARDGRPVVEHLLHAVESGVRRIELALIEAGPQPPRQRLDDPEADVVARAGVLLARVAQPADDLHLPLE